MLEGKAQCCAVSQITWQFYPDSKPVKVLENNFFFENYSEIFKIVLFK